MRLTADDLWHMDSALTEAERAFSMDEVPIGAVIVDPHGRVLVETHNLKECNNNPLGHAELIAIREASEQVKNWRLENCTLYVTLEPCPMCLAAMVQSRIGRLVFGAYDPKGGAISLGYNLHKDMRLNHSFEVIGGIKHHSCSKILSKFFRQKRSRYKKFK
ncbi:MAG: tRNA adenosine(34) deaminase TadA [Bacteriovoracaceae bacterium]|nr:tRNA adenosine(34) deaminase TadA [Bacteriovoracaceae bacterium]